MEKRPENENIEEDKQSKDPIQSQRISSFEDLPEEDILRLKRWLCSLVVVHFDIDEGQIVDYLFPLNSLSKYEERMVSYLSFPDSNTFASHEGVCKYIFRIKRDKAVAGEDSYNLGYTYFLQRKDPNLPRGYYQKSIVLLTNHVAHVNFFKRIISILGDLYFESQNKHVLEAAVNNIIFWPDPLPGKKYELPFLGSLIQIRADHCNNTPKKPGAESQEQTKEGNETNSQQNDPNMKQERESPEKLCLPQTKDLSPAPKSPSRYANYEIDNDLTSILINDESLLTGIFQEINIFEVMGESRIHMIWNLWELVLLNQPLLVIADDPRICSEVILGLISLIAPFEFTGDYKPYLTIYENDYRVVLDNIERGALKNLILGCTNPLFLKTMKGFPNVLRMDKGFEEGFRKDESDPKAKLPCLSTKEKCLTGPDKMLGKLLLAAVSEETCAINNSVIRKTFRNLNSQLIHIFGEYFKLQKNDVKIFNEKEFLEWINVETFPFKEIFRSEDNLRKLYANFFKTENFLKFVKNSKSPLYFAKTIR